MSPHELNLRALARALGGEVSGGQVLAPGPGHSAADRSLSVKPDPGAPDGFVVNSFAGDDPIDCRDYVRSKAGFEPFKPNGKHKPAPPTVSRKANGKVVATYDRASTGLVLASIGRRNRPLGWMHSPRRKDPLEQPST
jgi:hypothetical protein